VQRQVAGTFTTLYDGIPLWRGHVHRAFNQCLQALAIKALGVKEKVASRCDILSFYRGHRTVQHGPHVVEDLGISLSFPVRDGYCRAFLECR